MEENNTKSVDNASNLTLRVEIFCADIPASSVKIDKSEITFHNFDQVADANINTDIILIFNREQHSQKVNFERFSTLSFDGDFNETVVKTTIENIHKAISLGFTIDDFAALYNCEISIGEIEKHIDFIKKGFARKLLNRPATYGDGILKLDDALLADYATLFEHEAHYYAFEKFVPASGAASRMFGFLSKFLNEFDAEKDPIETYIENNNATDLQVFLDNVSKLPFYDDVNLILQENHPNLTTWTSHKKHFHFVAVMLNEEFLSFSCKPKGVLPFHTTNGKPCTPIEQHIQETFNYAASNNEARLHFTVSKEHQTMFEQIIESCAKHENHNLRVNYSYQEKSTDTIALDSNNQPLRDDNNKLHFRPSGHGALINNLNKLESDIIFIKNIDNVALKNNEEVSLYKKALAGLLLEYQSEIFSYLNNFENNEVDVQLLQHTISFAKEELNIQLSDNFHSSNFDDQKQKLAEILNRPIRVCGMVKNEGEPGGGPFWIDDNGKVVLQIIETTQIDLENLSQAEILNASTHFNPVDLVCSIKNYKNEKFNLLDFVDHSSGFVVQKNVDGVEIKAYELPGLWNGAMANWITVFVEVPQSTFNPVKTVNDLFKPAHQP